MKDSLFAGYRTGGLAEREHSHFFTPIYSSPVGHCFRFGTIPIFAGTTIMSRAPLPPFTWKAATEKVRAIEDSWNTREPALVALGYTIDGFWRSRIGGLSGRAAIEAFLTRKWAKQLEYRHINELWAFTDNRIAARFAYEYHDVNGNCYRAYGNENWEIDPDGLIRRRIACINGHPIAEPDRMFLWPLGRRPDDHPDLSDFDF